MLSITIEHEQINTRLIRVQFSEAIDGAVVDDLSEPPRDIDLVFSPAVGTDPALVGCISMRDQLESYGELVATAALSCYIASRVLFTDEATLYIVLSYDPPNELWLKACLQVFRTKLQGLWPDTQIMAWTFPDFKPMR